jgi:energy-coupling factor transporter ATP-binding protein EcfA2
VPADVDRPARGSAAGDDDERPRPRATASVLDAVSDLRRDVDRTRFPLRLEGVQDAERRRRQLLDQLDDHLIPRLRELSAPAVVVVAGSTGAGKSTLVNSVLGAEVTAAGVLRPTTRRPVLAHHPADAHLLADHPLLGIVDVAPREEVPRGIALVDAPDLDSLLASNRATAHRLLDAADLWVFVTTAARYGDAVPWAALDDAVTRGASMAMVLNRVPGDALTTVRADLMERLREHGLSTVPLFLIRDQGPHLGLLADPAVAPLRRWLTTVAGSDRARSVIQRTQRGTVRSLQPWVEDLAEAVQAQVDARVALEGLLEEATDSSAERAVSAVQAGAVVEGPVRARWAALSGAAGPLGGRWSARRGHQARVEGLAAVREELVTSATVVLAAARRYGAHAVATALSGSDLPGAEDLLTRLAAADEAPSDVEAAAAAASGWLTAAEGTLEGLLSGDRRGAAPAARLVRVAGHEGAAALLVASAGGLGAARVVVSGSLGTDLTQDAVGAVLDSLLSRVRQQAESGADPVRTLLAAPDLVDDASSRLRLRLAVLKGLP